MPLCWKEQSPLEPGWQWRMWVDLGTFWRQLARLACGLCSKCEAKCDPGQPRVVGLVVEKPLLASIFNLEKRRKRRKSNNWIYACEMTPSVGNFFKKYSAVCIFKSLTTNPLTHVLKSFSLLEKHLAGGRCDSRGVSAKTQGCGLGETSSNQCP